MNHNIYLRDLTNQGDEFTLSYIDGKDYMGHDYEQLAAKIPTYFSKDYLEKRILAGDWEVVGIELLTPDGISETVTPNHEEDEVKPQTRHIRIYNDWGSDFVETFTLQDDGTYMCTEEMFWKDWEINEAIGEGRWVEVFDQPSSSELPVNDDPYNLNDFEVGVPVLCTYAGVFDQTIYRHADGSWSGTPSEAGDWSKQKVEYFIEEGLWSNLRAASPPELCIIERSFINGDGDVIATFRRWSHEETWSFKVIFLDRSEGLVNSSDVSDYIINCYEKHWKELPPSLDAMGQWEADGTVKMHRVFLDKRNTDAIAVPTENGVVYITREEAKTFFGF